MTEEKKRAFEAYVEAVMESYDAAGMAVSVFDGEKTLYERYFGFRDADRRLRLDEDTIMGMASVSKSFTALGIMQMAERGILSPDEPAAEYIPRFRDRRVKIGHLLSHSAGYFPMKRILLKDVAEELGIYENGTRELGYEEALAERGLELVCDRMNRQQERLCEPGQYMSYCNDAYGLLSEIIRLYGGEKSYGEYVKRNIFEPLGMNRSFCEFVRPAQDENGTELYIHRDGVRVHNRDFYDNAFVLMGGGAIKSTVRDMKQYVRMYMADGAIPGKAGRAANRGSILRMRTPRQEYHYGQWYGYGIAGKRIGGLTVWGHGGSLTGISNYFAWEPRLGVGVIVLCNTTGVPAAAVADMAFRWAADLPLEPDEFAPVVPWTSELKEKAEGYYESGEGVRVELEAAGSGMRMTVGGREVPCRMLLPGLLEVAAPLVKDDLLLMLDDGGKVFGVRYRGRILPRKE